MAAAFHCLNSYHITFLVFQVGDKVQKGQVLCIVEAMKLMNEIEVSFWIIWKWGTIWTFYLP